MQSRLNGNITSIILAKQKSLFQCSGSRNSNSVINFHCSACQGFIEAPTQYAGVTAPCPHCGEDVTAPQVLEQEELAPVIETRRRMPSLRKSNELPRIMPTRGPIQNEQPGRFAAQPLFGKWALLPSAAVLLAGLIVLIRIELLAPERSEQGSMEIGRVGR